MRILLVGISLVTAFLTALFVHPWRSGRTSYAPPPRSILICGAQDYTCDTYVISYHPATHAYQDLLGEGVIDYERKTISIVWSNDRLKNVETIEREVFRAALRERGIPDTDKWAVHDWLSCSVGVFASLFHDNPEFVDYIAAGY